jgi:nitrous oxidase accessory protein NosD
MWARFGLLAMVVAGCQGQDEGGAAIAPGWASAAAVTAGPVLTLGPLVSGAPLRVQIDGGAPGSTVYLMTSFAGEAEDAGACPPAAAGVCVDLLPPTRPPVPVTLDAAGSALTNLSMPPRAVGTEVWLQGLVIAGPDSETTPVAAATYLGAGASCIGLGGTLSADLTLTAADGSCTLTSDMIVAPGVTLTLDAGARLLVASGVELEVKGHLQVNGNAVAPVTMRSSEAVPGPGSWQGIAFRETGTGELSYIDVQHADRAVYAEGIAPTLIGANLRNSNYGLYYDSAGSSTVTGGRITGNDVGVYASWSTVTVDRAELTTNRIGALGGSASTLNISNSRIANNTEAGIQPDGATITHNQITGNGVGVLTQLNWNTLSYNVIAGNDTGVVLGGYPIRKTLSFNHFMGNATDAVRYDGGYDDGRVDAEHNWWGTSDLATIDGLVFDVYDDITRFQVDVVPFLSAPHPGVGIIPEGWEDVDGDGFASVASGGNDCDDGASAVKPEGLDTSPDGVDSDCDGLIDEDVLFDVDGDGHFDDVDCDDGNASIYPGAKEIALDGVDDDCNGFDLEPPPSSVLSGVLVGDVLLTAAGSPYTVSGPIAVAPERTLQVEPGVQVRFDAGTDLLVKGTMVAEGLAGNEIVLTSSSGAPAPGDWNGVSFEGGATGQLAHLWLSYASTGFNFDDAGPTMDALVVEQCVTGIDIYGASRAMTASSLLDNGVGATVAWATLTFDDGVVSGNGTGLNGGSASTLDVSNTRIDRNDVGIHPDGAVIDHCDIQGNAIGIDTGLSWVTVEYSKIQENGIGVVLGGYPTRKVLNWNSFEGNTERAVQYVGGYSDGAVDATHNWWGSVQRILIREEIWDVQDDIDLFEVTYEPFLTEEHVGSGLIPAGTVDLDGDGYDDLASGGSDCDDSDPAIKPEGLDDTPDGVDDDCDGLVDDDVPVDADGDGYLDDVDCNDSDPAVNPGEPEVGRNGVDEDCNGSDLDDPTGPVDGVIGSDTILSAGLWVLPSDVAVPPGVTVVLEAGAELAFAADRVLRVKGTLLGEGVAANPVWLGADGSTAPGAWVGVTVEGPEAVVDLEHTVVQHAAVALDVDEGSAWLTNGELSQSLTGVSAYSPGALVIDGSIVSDCDLGGYISWGTLSFVGSTVEGCAVGLEGGSASTLAVSGSVVRDNGVGLRPDGGTITDSTIELNGTGIDTQLSWVTMSYLNIRDNGDGLVLGGYPIRKTLNHSNLTGNTGFAVRYAGGYDDGAIDCTSNWWGTTDPVAIAASIWDFDDDPALYPVEVDPILLAPEPDAGP